MEMAPEWGGGHGGGYFPMSDTPKFMYSRAEGRFNLRPHYLTPEWVCSDGSIYTSPGLLVWRKMHQFCEEHFSVWGIPRLLYHVSPIDNRIEFMRKQDAMIMKLAFVS